MSDTITAEVTPDGYAFVSITHPNGGVSEVIVYLHGYEELNVVVSPSRNNHYVITLDDVDIAESSSLAG